MSPLESMGRPQQTGLARTTLEAGEFQHLGGCDADVRVVVVHVGVVEQDYFLFVARCGVPGSPGCRRLGGGACGTKRGRWGGRTQEAGVWLPRRGGSA